MQAYTVLDWFPHLVSAAWSWSLPSSSSCPALHLHSCPLLPLRSPWQVAESQRPRWSWFLWSATDAEPEQGKALGNEGTNATFTWPYILMREWRHVYIDTPSQQETNTSAAPKGQCARLLVQTTSVTATFSFFYRNHECMIGHIISFVSSRLLSRKLINFVAG